MKDSSTSEKCVPELLSNPSNNNYSFNTNTDLIWLCLGPCGNTIVTVPLSSINATNDLTNPAHAIYVKRDKDTDGGY